MKNIADHFLFKYDLLSLADRVSDLIAKYPELEPKIRFLASKDPSGNQKYIDYAVKQLISKKALEHEIADVIGLFHKHNSRLPNRDINSYQNFTELRDLLFSIRDSGVKTTKEKKEIKQSGADKKYEDDQVLVLRVKNKASACFYGSNTKWCITMENETYFEDYDAKNILFYFLLRKDLDANDPRYKVAIVIHRDFNNKITEWEFFDALDERIGEFQAIYGSPDPDVPNNQVKNWDKIKSIIVADAPLIGKSILAKLGGPEIATLPIDEIKKLLDKADAKYLIIALQNQKVPQEIVEFIYQKYKNNQIPILEDRVEIAHSIASASKNPLILTEMYRNGEASQNVLYHLAGNEHTPLEILSKISEYGNYEISSSIINNKGDKEGTVLKELVDRKLSKFNEDMSERDIASSHSYDVIISAIFSPNITEDILSSIFRTNVGKYLAKNLEYYISLNEHRLNNTLSRFLVKHLNNHNKIMDAVARFGILDEQTQQKLLSFDDDQIKSQLSVNPSISSESIQVLMNDEKLEFGLLSNPSVPENIKSKILEKLPPNMKEIYKKHFTKSASKKMSLKEAKSMPIPVLMGMIRRAKNYLKKDEVWQKICKENEVSPEIIDLIPTRFGTLDVSAKTDHGVVILNYKLLCDGDFFKDYGYLIHEYSHWFQQCLGDKPTQGADEGEYLDNPSEQEGFANQVEYIANHEGEDKAEEYVDDLLDYHDVDDKGDKKEILMAKV